MSMLINYTSQKLRNLLLILLLMGLIFSVNWYTHQPLFNSYYADSDQQEYYEAGVKMAKLEGIIIYPHRMNLNSFIYAIFFRIFGPSFKLAILLNILFLTLCIPMLWYILGQLNITIPLRVCSLLLLVNVQISRFTEILSEPLLALTLCLFFTLLIKLAKYQKYHFLAGISLGLIFATHFSTIGLITIFVLYITILCLKKQNIKYCLHFLLGISILLIPIFVIRWYMFGTPLINSENIIKLTEGVDKVHISKIKKDNISFSSFLDFSERIKRGFKYSVPAIHREIYAPFLLPSLLLSLFFLMKNYQDLRYTLSIPLIITFWRIDLLESWK
ncbi:MAG: hypothetical protein NC918_08330 [Candidatus Omnitrophica bacterium]|nr:hypothetical protein [Candidatus Omnitrophota bacterium]